MENADVQPECHSVEDTDGNKAFRGVLGLECPAAVEGVGQGGAADERNSFGNGGV